MSVVAIISGVGLVTPLGASAEETWDALLAGKYIQDHVKVGLEFPADWPRVSHLALRAAREALMQAGHYDPAQIDALVLGTSKGPIECWLHPPAGLSDVAPLGDYGLSKTATDVADALGITAPRLTISAACASGLYALVRAAMLIVEGSARRVLTIAAEASVHPLFLASFERLGVLSGPAIGCRPFDRRRDGFLMSEASAAILLEAADSHDLPAGTVHVDQYALGADATHLTGIDPDAAALRHALDGVLATEPVDLLHAHGTGTAANDPLELATFDEAARSWPHGPILYSHKGSLGHSLGAAGLVSVALNALCHRQGLVPPNVRTTEPLPSDHVTISPTAVRRRVSRSLVAAMGFGGSIAAVTLQST